MAQEKNISKAVIKRLPRYYRFLGELLNQGVVRISSRLLSEKMGITASQIRQDLNCFGGFGQQGYGYNVQVLHEEIASILGLDRQADVILIGAGNLGRAVQTIKDVLIRSTDKIEPFCRVYHPTAAILCIPKTAAKELSDRLIAAGVKGFWNFSHYDLALNQKERGIVVENVHMSDSLMTLSYELKALTDKEEAAE